MYNITCVNNKQELQSSENSSAKPTEVKFI
jgi:hypothetical protein